MPDPEQRALLKQVRDITDLHDLLQRVHDFAEQRGVELVAAGRLPGSTEAVVIRVASQASGNQLAHLIEIFPNTRISSRVN